MRAGVAERRLQRGQWIKAAAGEAYPSTSFGTRGRDRRADAGSGTGHEHVLIFERVIRHGRCGP
jgi:hypothetical protein